MTEEHVEVTLHLDYRESVTFSCTIDSPVLEQLCRALVNKGKSPDQVHYLQLGGDDEQFIYFTSSSIDGIDATSPIPDEYFSVEKTPDVDDFQHLDLDRRWVEWALNLLQEGYDPDVLFHHMHDNGMPENDIAELLAHRPNVPTKVSRHRDIETIQPYGATSIDPACRFESEYIELYEIKDFMSDLRCQEFEDLFGSIPESNRNIEQPKIDQSRSGYSHIFDNGDTVNPLVRAYQIELSELLLTNLEEFESLRCQAYASSNQYRAHIDHFYNIDSERAQYQSYQGETRTGQRLWTVLVYLRDVEPGSGTWFSRIKKEFCPSRERP